MDDPGLPETGTMKQIDWDNMFENLPDDLNLFDFELESSLLSDLMGDGSGEEILNPSPDSVSLSIGEIEQLLMNDGEEGENRVVVAEEPILKFSNDILTDVLLDSPAGSDLSGDVVGASDGRNSNASEEEKEDVVPPTEKSDGDVDDPVSKKRKRQLRNKDAAMRSRERKKLYVRDLEMKSRYLEGECRRLGMLLQCCYAENQALRLSLQNNKAFDASMTKQESAVLLLESLLLGSLLWFLGVVCLHILPSPLKSSPGAVELEGVNEKNQESGTQKGAGNDIFVSELLQSFTTSKRCKASRPRMKPSHVAYVAVEVLA